MATADRLAHVQEVWTRMKSASPIYSFLLSTISVVSASDKSVAAELTVENFHLNSKGTLHGMVSACLVDWASLMAIAASGRDKTGVSTDLHVTYVSTAKLGDVLKIEATASRVGSSLAYTTVQIWKVHDENNTEVVCHGLHTKFVKQQASSA